MIFILSLHSCILKQFFYVFRGNTRTCFYDQVSTQQPSINKENRLVFFLFKTKASIKNKKLDA